MIRKNIKINNKKDSIKKADTIFGDIVRLVVFSLIAMLVSAGWISLTYVY